MFDRAKLVAALRLATLTAFCLSLAAPVLADDPGSAGLLSMRLGIGGRSGAMGETGVAIAEDATSVFWNPANLAYAPGTQMAVQHMEYFGLFRMESLTVSHQTDYGSFGLVFSGFYSDELDRTPAQPSGVTQGTFRPYDVVAGLGYARELEQFSIGVVGKMVYQRIDAYSGSTPAFDVGVTHHAVIDGLTMAAALQNFGPDMKLNEEEFPLPQVVRLGMAYRPIQDRWPALERLLTTAEILVPNDGNSRLHAGLEVELHESFQLRGGHRFQYDTWGPTFGLGFARGSLRVDYAYMANDNDFDATHRFSLGFRN